MSGTHKKKAADLSGFLTRASCAWRHTRLTDRASTLCALRLLRLRRARPLIS